MRLQSAQEQIGVGHSRLAATTVADGPGIGSGGFGADAQGSGRVEAGDGASASTHGVNVEHGNADRQAGDLGLATGADLPVHERNIGGSPSHVKRDDSFAHAAPRHGSGSDYTARGSGEHGAYRLADSRTESGDSAAGLHHEDADVSVAPALRAAIQILQIALH